jgi:hypothetical protein
MLLGTMAKVPYKHCKQIQCKKPKVGLKRCVPQDLFDESYNAQYWWWMDHIHIESESSFFI